LISCTRDENTPLSNSRMKPWLASNCAASNCAANGSGMFERKNSRWPAACQRSISATVSGRGCSSAAAASTTACASAGARPVRVAMRATRSGTVTVPRSKSAQSPP